MPTTLEELLNALAPPRTLFRSDPQSFEVVTGWQIVGIGIWCWFAGWFGDYLPGLAWLAGWEPAAGMLIIVYGFRHALGAHSKNLRRRARRCLVMSGFVLAVGVLLWQQKGWHIPAVPVCFVAALAQGWAYLRLTGRLA